MSRLLPLEHATRLAGLQTALATKDVDALWITKPVNVRYLCGFTGSNTQLVLTPSTATLITDGRYRSQADLQLAAGDLGQEIDVMIQTNLPEDGLAEIADTVGGISRIGIEADHLTVQRRARLLDALANAEACDESGAVDRMRQIKEPGERQRLELAASIADEALATQLGYLVPGTSECSFARDLDHQMRILGADDVSFSTIVAAGVNSALPHHQPGEAVFEDGDLVVIDFGAKIDGYGSDMTRTYVVGGQPSADQQRLYDAVAASQTAGVGAVRAGVSLSEIDRVCRQELSDRGYGDAFVHGTGHSLGLEIHEQPMLSSRSVGILRAGLIVTVEPGAYLPGFGGVRIEDSVVVTAEGAEPITHAPKGLVP